MASSNGINGRWASRLNGGNHMRTRHVFLIAILWVVSLLGVGLWAQRGAPADGAGANANPIGPVITGENIGFQPVPSELANSDRVTGYFVVKVHGRWTRVLNVPIVIR
ncbi:MAG TPA: hypothetical protein VJN96_03375 [Vicinamibacterales bacterium]|nr:hypothetical protein [Vicinamibacterales bacterium]